MSLAAAIVAGILFGLGLSISGMSNPENVLAFLVIGPDWNPALMLVMGAGLGVTAVGYVLVRRRPSPLWGARFRIPVVTAIDRPLLFGAALFGIGWGLSGYCPGPALVGGFVLDVRAAVFLLAFFAGLAAYEVIRFSKSRTTRAVPLRETDG